MRRHKLGNIVMSGNLEGGKKEREARRKLAQWADMAWKEA